VAALLVASDAASADSYALSAVDCIFDVWCVMCGEWCVMYDVWCMMYDV
jgi:hypothetical protein